MRVEASSDTAHTLSAIVLFVAVILAIEVCKLWQCCFIHSIVFDVMVWLCQCICIGFYLGIQSTQILACRLVQLNISAIGIRFIVVVQRLAGDQLIRVGSSTSRSQ